VNVPDEQLDKLLAFDPLAAAEKVTGVDHYSESDETMGLGVLLAQGHNRAKDRALLERGDTTFSSSLARYVAVIEGAGFERVLELPFAGQSLGETRDETLNIFAHRDGLLLKFDTYGGTSVNGGKVWYNWRPSDPENPRRFDVTSSGHMRRDGVWVGDHDCREALLYNLGRMRSLGDFVNPWAERPFLWLLHYMDTKGEDGYDYGAINAERIAMLPEWVRLMLGEEAPDV
jgi:hypothetical protein